MTARKAPAKRAAAPAPAGPDADALLARLTESGRAHGLTEDVDVPGVGTLTVRALTRDEVIGVRRAADLDPDKLDGRRNLVIERKMLAAAMVVPAMTEDHVRLWQLSAPAGELDLVANVVTRLSGMDPPAAKESYQGVRGAP